MQNLLLILSLTNLLINIVIVIILPDYIVITTKINKFTIIFFK